MALYQNAASASIMHTLKNGKPLPRIWHAKTETIALGPMFNQTEPLQVVESALQHVPRHLMTQTEAAELRIEKGREQLEPIQFHDIQTKATFRNFLKLRQAEEFQATKIRPLSLNQSERNVFDAGHPPIQANLPLPDAFMESLVEFMQQRRFSRYQENLQQVDEFMQFQSNSPQDFIRAMALTAMDILNLTRQFNRAPNHAVVEEMSPREDNKEADMGLGMNVDEEEKKQESPKEESPKSEAKDAFVPVETIDIEEDEFQQVLRRMGGILRDEGLEMDEKMIELKEDLPPENETSVGNAIRNRGQAGRNRRRRQPTRNQGQNKPLPQHGNRRRNRHSQHAPRIMFNGRQNNPNAVEHSGLAEIFGLFPNVLGSSGAQPNIVREWVQEAEVTPEEQKADDAMIPFLGDLAQSGSIATANDLLSAFAVDNFRRLWRQSFTVGRIPELFESMRRKYAIHVPREVIAQLERRQLDEIERSQPRNMEVEMSPRLQIEYHAASEAHQRHTAAVIHMARSSLIRHIDASSVFSEIKTNVVAHEQLAIVPFIRLLRSLCGASMMNSFDRFIIMPDSNVLTDETAKLLLQYISTALQILVDSNAVWLVQVINNFISEPFVLPMERRWGVRALVGISNSAMRLIHASICIAFQRPPPDNLTAHNLNHWLEASYIATQHVDVGFINLYRDRALLREDQLAFGRAVSRFVLVSAEQINYRLERMQLIEQGQVSQRVIDIQEVDAYNLQRVIHQLREAIHLLPMEDGQNYRIPNLQMIAEIMANMKKVIEQMEGTVIPNLLRAYQDLYIFYRELSQFIHSFAGIRQTAQHQVLFYSTLCDLLRYQGFNEGLVNHLENDLLGIARAQQALLELPDNRPRQGEIRAIEMKMNESSNQVREALLLLRTEVADVERANPLNYPISRSAIPMGNGPNTPIDLRSSSSASSGINLRTLSHQGSIVQDLESHHEGLSHAGDANSLPGSSSPFIYGRNEERKEPGEATMSYGNIPLPDPQEVLNIIQQNIDAKFDPSEDDQSTVLEEKMIVDSRITNYITHGTGGTQIREFHRTFGWDLARNGGRGRNGDYSHATMRFFPPPNAPRLVIAVGEPRGGFVLEDTSSYPLLTREVFGRIESVMIDARDQIRIGGTMIPSIPSGVSFRNLLDVLESIAYSWREFVAADHENIDLNIAASAFSIVLNALERFQVKIDENQWYLEYLKAWDTFTMILEQERQKPPGEYVPEPVGVQILLFGIAPQLLLQRLLDNNWNEQGLSSRDVLILEGLQLESEIAIRLNPWMHTYNTYPHYSVNDWRRQGGELWSNLAGTLEAHPGHHVYEPNASGLPMRTVGLPVGFVEMFYNDLHRIFWADPTLYNDTTALSYIFMMLTNTNMSFFRRHYYDSERYRLNRFHHATGDVSGYDIERRNFHLFLQEENDRRQPEDRKSEAEIKEEADQIKPIKRHGWHQIIKWYMAFRAWMQLPPDRRGRIPDITQYRYRGGDENE